MDSIGFDWIRLDWAGLGWIGPVLICLGLTYSYLSGLDLFLFVGLDLT